MEIRALATGLWTARAIKGLLFSNGCGQECEHEYDYDYGYDYDYD